MNWHGRWAVATVLMAVLAALIWRSRAADEHAPPSLHAPSIADAMASSPWTVEPLAAASRASAPPTAARGPDEIDLCGGKWVKKRSDGEIDEDELDRVTGLPQIRARLVDQLRASPDELARAVGLWMNSVSSPEARDAMLKSGPCDTPECAAKPPNADYVAGRDALVRMALTTSDPKVYAFAFNYCGRTSTSRGACSLLSAEQWARLDPGNAAPWFFMLGRGSADRGGASEAEVLHRIATSTRSDLHYFALPAAMLAHLPDDDASKVASLALTSEAIAMGAVWSLPEYQPLMKACSNEALRDPNRRKSCEATAELLVERSSTLLERGIGIALGRRLDWPLERTDRLRGETLAFHESNQPGDLEKSNMGCALITHELDMIKRLAHLGEIGSLREWVKRSGKSAEDFVRIERTMQLKRAAQAASAAAAASAASAASAAR